MTESTPRLALAWRKIARGVHVADLPALGKRFGADYRKGVAVCGKPDGENHIKKVTCDIQEDQTDPMAACERRAWALAVEEATRRGWSVEPCDSCGRYCESGQFFSANMLYEKQVRPTADAAWLYAFAAIGIRPAPAPEAAPAVAPDPVINNRNHGSAGTIDPRQGGAAIMPELKQLIDEYQTHRSAMSALRGMIDDIIHKAAGHGLPLPEHIIVDRDGTVPTIYRVEYVEDSRGCVRDIYPINATSVGLIETNANGCQYANAG
jgi:hypothetical protein